MIPQPNPSVEQVKMQAEVAMQELAAQCDMFRARCTEMAIRLAAATAEIKQLRTVIAEGGNEQ